MTQTSVETPPLARRCITYGTFDLLHDGHRRFLAKAREYGTYLIVAVVTDGFNAARGKYNIRQSTIERVAAIQQSGLADEIILEECDAKINDILKYKIDVCVVESEWEGSLQCREYIRQYCELVVVERTANISSTLLRGKIMLGLMGTKSKTQIVVHEVEKIIGLMVSAILQETGVATAHDGRGDAEIFFPESTEDFFKAIDAVYISTDGAAVTIDHAEKALSNGKHVLYEPPLASCASGAAKLRDFAFNNDLILLEASPIAYLPALERLIAVAQNGKIGRIYLVSINYMVPKEEHRTISMGTLVRTPLVPVVKLLGLGDISAVEEKHVRVHNSDPELTRIDVSFHEALATITVGKGIVLHEDLMIAGSKGYVYVSAPWWRMTSFEVRMTEANFEDSNMVQTFHVSTRGEGYRYDIAEFARAINACATDSHRFSGYNARTIDQCVENLEA